MSIYTPNWDKIMNALGSTTTTFGGSWGNLISDYYNGVNIVLIDPTKKPKIGTPTAYKYETLELLDVDESHKVTVSVDDIDDGVDRIIKIKRMNPPYVTDNIVMEGMPQPILNKDIDFDLNTGSNIENDNIKVGAGITDNKLAQITDFNKLPTETLSTTNTAIISNKIIDIKNNTWLRMGRVGIYSPATALGAFDNVSGSLKGLVGIGNQGTTNLNTGGKYHVWSTFGTNANDAAGVVKLDTFTTWRITNPLIRFSFLFVANTSSNRRMFKGWGSDRLVSVTSNNSPLNSNEYGFLFGHGATDTQFQIFHNDASGTCNKTTTGINLPASNTNYILEIQAIDTTPSFIWTLYSVSSPGIRNAVLGTGTFTTEIPAQTSHLYMQDIIAATDTSVQANNIHMIEVF